MGQVFKSKGNFVTLLSLIFLCVFFTGQLYAAGDLIKSEEVTMQQVVRGTVVDAENGMPLPGVSIVEKGTQNGTVTDFDGNYEITVSNPNAVLVFSYVGFLTQEISVNGETEIDVSLTEDLNQLGEVVVVGFGTQRRENLTGAVATVDSENFENRPVQNATQMLQGVVGGLNITQGGGGSLEDNPSINIRGTGTIGAGSQGQPLVLIDGMEGDINSINPQDIQSISVLKDAAASSIYGSRAPFGVILITTKSGKEGAPLVTYNNNFRVSSPINVPNMMDSYTFALFINDASTNGGSSPFFSDDRVQRILDYQNGVLENSIIPNPNNPERWADGYAEGVDNVDWYDAIYRDQAFSQEHNFSVRGGSDAITYYVSGNYLDQLGLMEFNRDEFNRYTATAKIDAKITDWASLNLSNRWIREDFGRPSRLSGGLFQDLARQGWPILPLYDPNGFLYSSPSPALGLAEGGRDELQQDWLYQQAQLVLTPIDGWEIFGEFNYRTRNDFRHWHILQTYNHDVAGDPYLYGRGSHVHEEAFRENFFNTNIYTKYHLTLNEAHEFDFMIGFQSEENKNRNLMAQREGIILPSSPVIDLTTGLDSNGEEVPPSVAGAYNNWATMGYFSRINYNYLGRYLLEANIRYDGTSRYREEGRWNWFPSFSAGWNIAEEPFWDSVSEDIGMLKLRASWGELGNQNTNNWYPTYATMPIGIANGNWLVNGAQPNTSNAPGLVTPGLVWERVQSWNIGLDVSAFNNRLTSSFDYFNRYTLDMTGPAPERPVILGTAVPRANNTDLKTYGWEFSLSWQDLLGNDLSYQVQVNLSDSQTKVTRYPNLNNSLNTFVEGRNLGEIWGYETIGIAKTDEEMQAHLASLANGGQDALGSQWQAGDIMYADLNGDGRIDGGSSTIEDPGDRTVIGNNTARFPFSVDISANWKGFDARIFFQGIMKRDYFQGSYYFWGIDGGSVWWSTGLEEHEDYFRSNPDHPLGQNLDAYFPRPLFNWKNKQTQSRYVQDASYVRLKNAQIGYTIPADLTQRIGMNKLRVFVSGENLWTLTDLIGVFDPETIGGGYGGNVYPLSSTVSAGLTLNF